MADTFVPGQRWLSDAEPDLGLGRVERVVGRHVQMVFPASGEQRTYAIGTAPLTRVRLAPDDPFEDRDGEQGRVVAVAEVDGLLSYSVVDARGQRREFAEQALSDHLDLARPQDRLLSGRIDADHWFTLRMEAWLQNAVLARSPVLGLRGPRVDLIPHQLYIAAEVAGRERPRVLLADEVGLGKTIEAGLILHRQLLTGRASRVLVLVPDALVNQWLVEMLRRFNLRFAVFDEQRFAEADDDNPFHAEQQVLCSLAFATASAAVGEALLDGEWDLLIVDEAHHLVWNEHDPSPAYRLVEALAGVTPGVLLLTATPEQLGRAGHFGRLRLLDPQRFHDFTAFLAEEAHYVPVAALAADLVAGRELNDAQHALLGELLGEEAGLPRDQVVERLIDRHGTGRVLFRNTRQAVSGFPQRRLHTYPMTAPSAYTDCCASATPEHEYAGDWVAIDPRVTWLRELLIRLAPHKVLVICAHADTAMALREHLMERFAIHVAVFHENMEIVARDRAAAYFADPDDGAQALICSEIGSEGRNFQFAHHLVLFDLPRDPDLLEQRIGRLDRIGQRDTIEIHVPYLGGSAGEVLMYWYRDGLASFDAICPAASAVYARLREALEAAMDAPRQVARLVEQAAALTARFNAELEAGRDRLLELHSFDAGRAARLVERLRGADEAVPLADYLARYWDAFGLEHEPGPGRSLVLRPGAHMLHDHYPGLGSEASTATFTRSDALAHEDRQFLTWEHPIARGALDMLLNGELGSAAVTLCSHPTFRTGSVFLEVLCVIECNAPRALGVQHYLPPTCQRLLLDLNGRDRAAELAHDELTGLCLSRNRKLADTVIKSQAARIKALVGLAAGMAEDARTTAVAQARGEMHATLDAEIQRLTVLAAVNPNVSADEVAQLRRRRELIADHIGAARARIDALRLVVMR